MDLAEVVTSCMIHVDIGSRYTYWGGNQVMIVKGLHMDFISLIEVFWNLETWRRATNTATVQHWSATNAQPVVGGNSFDRVLVQRSFAKIWGRTSRLWWMCNILEVARSTNVTKHMCRLYHKYLSYNCNPVCKYIYGYIYVCFSVHVVTPAGLTSWGGCIKYIVCIHQLIQIPPAFRRCVH